MLNFAVYHDKKPLAEWPQIAKTVGWCMYLADADGRPREKSFDLEYARLVGYCPPHVRRRLFTRHHVKDFGDPILRTRVLTSGPKLRNLTVELALGRLELIDEQRAAAEKQGHAFPRPLLEKIEQARALAAEAARRDARGDRAEAGALADESLALGVPAGEELALDLARAKVRRRQEAGGFKGFLLGSGGVPNKEKSPDSFEHYVAAFNYATLPFYLKGMEPAPGRVDYGVVPETARALRAHGFKIKGHPLVWTFTVALPEHRKGLDFETCCKVFEDRIRRDVPPFRDLIEYWDIIIEAHDTPWANSFGLTAEQNVELTRLAAATTREVAPDSRLVVNVCLPFGEYAAGAPGRVTTMEYVKACIAAGVDFDTIGIQFYFGAGALQYCWDMLEVSRILDEYAALGKEVHIAELGTPSANGVDPAAYIHKDHEVGFWHNAWTPETQADWVEQFYTLSLSKPAITAITWWSFSEEHGTFWPYGGLLDKAGNPKPAYHRVVELRRMAGL